jgi:hypothetical protein
MHCARLELRALFQFSSKPGRRNLERVCPGLRVSYLAQAADEALQGVRWGLRQRGPSEITYPVKSQLPYREMRCTPLEATSPFQLDDASYSGARQLTIRNNTTARGGYYAPAWSTRNTSPLTRYYLNSNFRSRCIRYRQTSGVVHRFATFGPNAHFRFLVVGSLVRTVFVANANAVNKNRFTSQTTAHSPSREHGSTTSHFRTSCFPNASFQPRSAPALQKSTSLNLG